MVVVITMMPLPHDIAITDRSRKFYDGTYKWDADGFTDDCGVYREFDCLDPLARAPTPMPSMFSDHEEVDEQLYDAASEPTNSLESDTISTPKTAAVDLDVPCRRPTVSPLTPRSVRRSAIELIAKFKPTKIALEDELDKQPKNDDAAIGKPEDNVLESKRAGLDEDPHKGLELPEPSLRAKTESSNIKLPDTPPESPVNAFPGTQIISPATTSTLSPVPSNLSDQDQEVDLKVISTCNYYLDQQLTMVDQTRICDRAKYPEPAQYPFKDANPNQDKGINDARRGSESYKELQEGRY